MRLRAEAVTFVEEEHVLIVEVGETEAPLLREPVPARQRDDERVLADDRAR